MKKHVLVVSRSEGGTMEFTQEEADTWEVKGSFLIISKGTKIIAFFNADAWTGVREYERII